MPPGLFRSHDFNDVFRRENLNASHFQLRVQGSSALWQLQPEMESRPENLVRLSSQRDRFGDPSADVVLGFSQRDWQTRQRGVDLLHGYAKRLAIEPPDITTSPNWRSHPAGTCRMGTDASPSRWSIEMARSSVWRTSTWRAPASSRARERRTPRSRLSLWRCVWASISSGACSARDGNESPRRQAGLLERAGESGARGSKELGARSGLR